MVEDLRSGERTLYEHRQGSFAGRGGYGDAWRLAARVAQAQLTPEHFATSPHWRECSHAHSYNACDGSDGEQPVLISQLWRWELASTL